MVSFVFFFLNLFLIFAAPVDYVIDHEHTTVAFEVGHLGFSTVSGKFREFEGQFLFDEKDFAKTKLTATAKTESLTTENEKRDNHLRSPDFFDAQKPENQQLKFESTTVTNATKNKFKLNGSMTIRGTTLPVTFDVDYKGMVNAFSKQRVAFSATTKINRKKFGMSFAAVAELVPLVGDEVTITIKAEGIRKSDLAAK